MVEDNKKDEKIEFKYNKYGELIAYKNGVPVEKINQTPDWFFNGAIKKFHILTSYIKKFEDINFGEWILKKKCEGKKDCYQLPFVKYDRIVNKFIEDFYYFHESHPKYNLLKYHQILEDKKIQITKEFFDRNEIENLDENTVLAIIMYAIRMERFGDGNLLHFLESGVITKCLKRLDQIDNEKINARNKERD